MALVVELPPALVDVVLFAEVVLLVLVVEVLPPDEVAELVDSEPPEPPAELPPLSVEPAEPPAPLPPEPLLPPEPPLPPLLAEVLLPPEPPAEVPLPCCRSLKS